MIAISYLSVIMVVSVLVGTIVAAPISPPGTSHSLNSCSNTCLLCCTESQDATTELLLDSNTAIASRTTGAPDLAETGALCPLTAMHDCDEYWYAKESSTTTSTATTTPSSAVLETPTPELDSQVTVTTTGYPFDIITAIASRTSWSPVAEVTEALCPFTAMYDCEEYWYTKENPRTTTSQLPPTATPDSSS
jgi:hypothetical protein